MGKDKLTEVEIQDPDAGNINNIVCDDSTFPSFCMHLTFGGGWLGSGIQTSG